MTKDRSAQPTHQQSNQGRLCSIAKTRLFKYIKSSPPKTENFQIEILIFFLFLLKNIDCEYRIYVFEQK